MSKETAFLAVLIILLIAANADAAGKKRQSAPPAPAPTKLVATTPIREVIVQKVAGKAFQIPTGTVMDLSADIRSMLLTSLSGTQNLAPTDPINGENPAVDCASHIELRAAVSTLEMNLQEYGLTIGYSPTGTHNGLTSVQGETRVKVGAISMDFSLWRCNGRKCTLVAATTANQSTVDSELGFTINFGLITSGATLASHPSFNKILRKIVQSGVQQLAQSPRISELPWTATVREAQISQGLLLIDSGSQDRLSENQKLVIYTILPTTGSCGVFKAIAYARVERVDPVSSVVIIEQTLDARDVSEGDIVMLK